MKVYNIEKDLGLEVDIRASLYTNIIASTKLDIGKDSNLAIANQLPEDTKKYLGYGSCNSYIADPDIIHSYGILVTNNWNRNDDVFSSDEMWKARNTPRMKPVDRDHQRSEKDPKNQIMGVIAQAVPVDENYNVIDSPTQPGGKFHILVDNILWARYWPTAVAEIMDSIDNNTQYLSMEVFLSDFGYAIRNLNNQQDDTWLLPRNELTAGLTQYLKAFKGPGVFDTNGQKYQIGRWLKGMTFTGVGYVKVPGNPDSITFDSIAHFKYLKEADDLILLNGIINSSQENSVLSERGSLTLWL